MILLAFQIVIGFFMIVGIPFGIYQAIRDGKGGRADRIPPVPKSRGRSRRRMRDDDMYTGGYVDGFITDEALHELDDMFK